MDLGVKTCPNCGAENRMAAGECRLCASSLEEAAGSTESQSSDQAAESSGSSRKICPSCRALNEPEWVFCMRCGKKLPGRESKPDRPPEEYITQPKVRNQPAAERNNNEQIEDRRASGDSGGIVCKECGEVNTATGFYCAGCGLLLSSSSESDSSQPGRRAVLQLIGEGGQVGEIHTLDRPETFIGRVDGDLIFPHDGFMSSRHARITERNGRYFLRDQDSRNGTFIRIDREVELRPGDMFLVGKQLFRFEK